MQVIIVGVANIRRPRTPGSQTDRPSQRHVSAFFVASTGSERGTAAYGRVHIHAVLDTTGAGELV
jgi:hypothetical protein